MISQDLNNEKNSQGKRYIPSKNELITNSKFGKLSNNYLFIVEACFEHTLIYIIKKWILRRKGHENSIIMSSSLWTFI